MRLPLLAALVVVACKKPAPPPVDLDSLLHGTRPPSSIPLIGSFSATAHDGAPRGPGALQGHKTVLWFFPAANTSGCTVEGCGYRDLYGDFKALGFEIVGVSFTDVQTNAEWAAAQSFPYEIWRDDTKQLALYYGVIDDPSATYPKRRTRVLDEEGRVLIEYNDKVVVGAHPEEVLADVKLLLGKK